MNSGQLLTPNEAREALRCARSGSEQAYDVIYDKLIRAIKGTTTYEDLELSSIDNDFAGKVADALFDYQIHCYLESWWRKSNRKKDQERQIAATLKSVKDAADRIGSLLANMPLCIATLSALPGSGYTRHGPPGN